MTRNETGLSALDRPSKQRLYRRLMYGFVFGGVAAGLVLRELLGYPLLGEGVYWVGILGFFTVWRGTSLTLFDERDRALEQRASHLTLTLAAGALIVGASAARLVPRVSSYAVPPEIWPALYAYVALFCVFGIAYTWLRHR